MLESFDKYMQRTMPRQPGRWVGNTYEYTDAGVIKRRRWLKWGLSYSFTDSVVGRVEWVPPQHVGLGDPAY